MESNPAQLLVNSSLSLQNSSQLQPRGDSQQELYFTIAICIVHMLLCPVALLGNFATLIAIWKTSSLHSPANVLLSSLAVSDFAVGLISHPSFIAKLLSKVLHISAFSRVVFESFNHISSCVLCTSSFLTVTAIGIDRLLALYLHLRYQSLVTCFRVSWVVLSIWVFSAFLASSWVWSKDLYANLLGPLIVILLVINVVVYLSIYRIVRRHQRQIQQQQENNGNIFRVKRSKKSAANTLLVYILLLCCYTPWVFTSFVKTVPSPTFVYNIIGLIVLLNSSLNPLLYCWRVREIRLAIKHTFCCWNLGS